MKILKGFLSFIISTILFVLLLFFSINIIFKGVIQKQLIGGIAKEQIISDYLKKQDIENKEEIEKLLDDKEAENIANDVVNEYMEYLADNTHTVSKKTVNNILDFCLKHREELNKISSENITEEEIKSEETFNNLYNSINDGFVEVSNEIGDTPREVIKVYANITSKNMIIILAISIIICVVLLMLIKNSLYRWMSTFGSSLLSCGLIIIGLYFTLNYALKEIINKQNFDFTINIKLDQILTIGILESIIGIIMIITKIIISKVKIEKKSKQIQPVQNDRTTVNVAVQQPVTSEISQPEVSNVSEQPSQPVEQRPVVNSMVETPVNSSISQPTETNNNIEQ